jgi:hypothetical protein
MEDFQGWTKEVWGLITTGFLREFQDFLRENGLFITKNQVVVATNITTVLLEET